MHSKKRTGNIMTNKAIKDSVEKSVEEMEMEWEKTLNSEESNNFLDSLIEQSMEEIKNLNTN